MVNSAIIAMMMILLTIGLVLIASLPPYFSEVHKIIFVLALLGVTSFVAIKA